MLLLSQVADEGVAFFADGVAGISHASALNHAAAGCCWECKTTHAGACVFADRP
ncbi:hypothetical protein [Xanthomonas campestris]|uniref:hypothetical protein n=1 Tax=Xanthomonas campestris TaxID=339 RepID=UPI00164CAB7B|nr:hypothetical protein [Xanthomonas campestris]